MTSSEKLIASVFLKRADELVNTPKAVLTSSLPIVGTDYAARQFRDSLESKGYSDEQINTLINSYYAGLGVNKIYGGIGGATTGALLGAIAAPFIPFVPKALGAAIGALAGMTSAKMEGTAATSLLLNRRYTRDRASKVNESPDIAKYIKWASQGSPDKIKPPEKGSRIEGHPGVQPPAYWDERYTPTRPAPPFRWLDGVDAAIRGPRSNTPTRIEGVGGPPVRPEDYRGSYYLEQFRPNYKDYKGEVEDAYKYYKQSLSSDPHWWRSRPKFNHGRFLSPVDTFYHPNIGPHFNPMAWNGGVYYNSDLSNAAAARDPEIMKKLFLNRFRPEEATPEAILAHEVNHFAQVNPLDINNPKSVDNTTAWNEPVGGIMPGHRLGAASSHYGSRAESYQWLGGLQHMLSPHFGGKRPATNEADARELLEYLVRTPEEEVLKRYPTPSDKTEPMRLIRTLKDIRYGTIEPDNDKALQKVIDSFQEGAPSFEKAFPDAYREGHYRQGQADGDESIYREKLEELSKIMPATVSNQKPTLTETSTS